MDPKAIADVSNSIVGIVTALISWGGVIILFLVFRNFIIAGISRAFIQAFESGNEKTRETLVRFLVDKNLAVPEIYANLKKVIMTLKELIYSKQFDAELTQELLKISDSETWAEDLIDLIGCLKKDTLPENCTSDCEKLGHVYIELRDLRQKIKDLAELIRIKFDFRPLIMKEYSEIIEDYSMDALSILIEDMSKRKSVTRENIIEAEEELERLKDEIAKEEGKFKELKEKFIVGGIECPR